MTTPLSPETDQHLVTALLKLQAFIEKEQFKGYDPYDTLNSPFKFRYLGKMIPILAIQFQKRNPVNIRPLLGIKKGYNPKGLGLLLYGYSVLQKEQPAENHDRHTTFLFEYLKNNYSRGYSGYCWGYNFDWASSGKYISAHSPNVVVTAFIAKGLFKYYEVSRHPEALTILKSIGEFILNDLPRTDTNEGLCFSYTTLGVDCCYNASLLAAEVLAHLYALTKEERYKTPALRAVDYVVHKQHEDGHWNYSIEPGSGKERAQIDFHQGYVIDSIYHVMRYTGEYRPEYEAAIEKGTTYYRQKQFFDTGRSLWRLPKEYPVEIHNQSQGIITFARMAHLDPAYRDFAKTIAGWTINHMQDEKGFFYYKKLKSHSHKIPYMRWSQAWMFVALVELLYTTKSQHA